jgi:hypothetical protein
MSSLLKNPSLAREIFEGWQDSCIWSCLQGIMGEIYVDDCGKPSSAMAVLGDFCFLSGKPDRELVCNHAGWTNSQSAVLIPQNEEWTALIRECYGNRAKEAMRYAIKKEPGIFDREKLQQAVDSLPDAYTMQLMDENLFHWCRNHDWSREFAANYRDYDQYRAYGLGVMILKDGIPVSGVSSYSGYDGGIEIEIITHTDYRRQGLAYIGGARIILECMDRNLYPNWDAGNLRSKNLAEKLGYHYSHEYISFEVNL